MQKKCELCGSEFSCAMGRVCWCTAVEVSAKRKAEVSAGAHDCVCPECLAGRTP